MTARFDRTFAAAALLIYAVVYLGVALTESAAKPLWHDEIYTSVLANLPSVPAIWQAERDGLDLGPPLNSLATHAVVAVAGVSPIALRFPAMAGFALMSVMVFAIAWRRSNAVVATAALLIPFFTAALPYSYEARSYGLMLGLFATSLYLWSEAAAGRRRAVALPLLSLTLAASLWNHYYSVLACLPLAFGELTRVVRARRIDRAMLAAFGAAIVLVLPLTVLLRVAVGQASGYWQDAAWSDLDAAYSFVAGFLTARRFLALYLVVGILVAMTWRRRAATVPAAGTTPAHEIVAGITSVLIPLIGVSLGLLVTGIFVDRYAIAGVVGLAIVLPLTVWTTGRRRSLPIGVLALGLAAALVHSATLTLWLQRPRFVHPIASRPQLARALGGSTPVVVTGINYLQTWHYASDVQRRQLRYPADPASAQRLIGTNTVERGYLEMVRRVPIGVEPLDRFVAAHPMFHVYALPLHEWLMTKLREDGLAVIEVAREEDAVLYEVTRR